MICIHGLPQFRKIPVDIAVFYPAPFHLYRLHISGANRNLKLRNSEFVQMNLDGQWRIVSDKFVKSSNSDNMPLKMLFFPTYRKCGQVIFNEDTDLLN